MPKDNKDNKKSPESIAKGLAKDIKKNVQKFKSSGVMPSKPSDSKETGRKKSDDKPMSMGEIGAKAFKDRQEKKSSKSNGKQKS